MTLALSNCFYLLFEHEILTKLNSEEMEEIMRNCDQPFHDDQQTFISIEHVFIDVENAHDVLTW